VNDVENYEKSLKLKPAYKNQLARPIKSKRWFFSSLFCVFRYYFIRINFFCEKNRAFYFTGFRTNRGLYIFEQNDAEAERTPTSKNLNLFYLDILKFLNCRFGFVRCFVTILRNSTRGPRLSVAFKKIYIALTFLISSSSWNHHGIIMSHHHYVYDIDSEIIINHRSHSPPRTCQP
jgi:hypothetical protein